MQSETSTEISGFHAEMSDLSRCLPPFIWTEILRKLPPKILGQCRCVCKSWDFLIVSPAFLAAHLKCYTQNESNTLLLYKHVSKPPVKEEEYTIFSDSAANLDARYGFTCPLLPKKNFHIIGSLNGLLLLMDEAFGHGTLLVLWNPLIQRYIILPPPKATSDRGTSKEFFSVFGLGYDSRIDDYKVVRLLYMQGADGLDVTPPVVEVYSVQKGVWSEPLVVNYFDDICICRCWWSQCFAKGSIHWIAWERDHKTRVFKRKCLLLFDVEQEKFKKMKLPEVFNEVNALNLRVSDSGGKLSVIFSEMKDGVAGKQMKLFSIWVKKEYNVGASWCKMVALELGPNGRLKFVQYLRKGGGQVLGFDAEGELLCCNLHPPQTKRLGLRGRQRSWFTFDYSESLVFLDKRHGVYSYDAGCHKKRYGYVVKNGSPTVMEEYVNDNNNDEDQSAGIFEHPRYKKLISEQLVKMHGGSSSMDLDEIINVEGEDTMIYFPAGED